MTDTRRPAANDVEGSPAFTLTRAELEALVNRAVSAALYLRSSTPMLVDKQGLAQLLSCSPTHVDHLRKQGLPSKKVGNLVRFEPAKVLEWLRDAGVA